MSYTEWLKGMAKLPKSAEFCLTDVTERISSGTTVINFLITEALGDDIDPNSRRGGTSKVCRPRMYLYCGDSEEANGGRSENFTTIEIAEPIAGVEKRCISTYSFSLHDFYTLQSRLCESVLASLTEKVNVISERSKAILESQLGDEIVKLVTVRLSTGEEQDSGLKDLLVKQISGAMAKNIARPVKQAVGNDETVSELKLTDGELYWEYHHNTRIDLELHWKGIQLNWDGSEGSVTTDIKQLCVRDTFLYLVNLPSFGKMIASKLEKIVFRDS